MKIVPRLNDVLMILASAILDALVDITLWSFKPWLNIPKAPFKRVLGLQAEYDLDERIQKIETARTNLLDALSAVDELERSAQQNKRELEAIAAALQKAESQKLSAEEELDSLKKLATLEAGAVRKTFGVPTPREVWRDRILGFIFGAITSLLLSAAWDFILKPLLQKVLGFG